MYTLTGYDIINGGKTEIHIVEGLQFNSIAEIDQFQNELQETAQSGTKHKIEVLCHYKCLPLFHTLNGSHPEHSRPVALRIRSHQ